MVFQILDLIINFLGVIALFAIAFILGADEC